MFQLSSGTGGLSSRHSLKKALNDGPYNAKWWCSVAVFWEGLRHLTSYLCLLMKGDAPSQNNAINFSLNSRQGSLILFSTTCSKPFTIFSALLVPVHIYTIKLHINNSCYTCSYKIHFLFLNACVCAAITKNTCKIFLADTWGDFLKLHVLYILQILQPNLWFCMYYLARFPFSHLNHTSK